MRIRRNAAMQPKGRYVELVNRQQQIEKEIGKLTKEKVKNVLRIIRLVLDHEEVKKLHQSK